MKVGNVIGGLEVTDVKRVNKLNLIQFLKEVDSYLQQGYQIDVNSARQVGLVLQADVYKVEQPFGHSGSVGSTEVGSVGEQSVESTQPAESVASKEGVSVPEPQSTQVEGTVEDIPVASKKTTTRSKKTAQ